MFAYYWIYVYFYIYFLTSEERVINSIYKYIYVKSFGVVSRFMLTTDYKNPFNSQPPAWQCYAITRFALRSYLLWVIKCLYIMFLIFSNQLKNTNNMMDITYLSCFQFNIFFYLFGVGVERKISRTFINDCWKKNDECCNRQANSTF